jgi:hypothetical protein
MGHKGYKRERNKYEYIQVEQGMKAKAIERLWWKRLLLLTLLFRNKKYDNFL